MEGFEESASLDSRQVIFFNAVMNALHKKEATMFFLEGPSGTGKTYLLNAIHRQALIDGKRVAASAFSQIGATLLHRGRTTHSLFVLPWNRPKVVEEDLDMNGIEAEFRRSDWLSFVDIILWDEVPRSAEVDLEKADEVVRELSRVDSPFGGKVVVFAGDQRGLLTPIYPLQPNAFSWALWPSVKAFSLTMNYKFSEDWFKTLTDIGSGGCELGSLKPGTPKYAVHLNSDMIVQSPQELIAQTFAECIDEKNPKPTRERALLTLTNVDAVTLSVDILNYIRMGRNVHDIEGKTEPECSKDRTPSEYPPHILKLTVGAEVYLVKNVYFEATNVDLRSGTILTISEITEDYLMCNVQNGIHAGREVKITKERFVTDFYTRRTQFPVRLLYAMTIHKAQGRSLDRVGLYLSSNVFAHGQLYAALSRVKRQEDIKIYLGDDAWQQSSDKNPEIISIFNQVNQQAFIEASRAQRLG